MAALSLPFTHTTPPSYHRSRNIRRTTPALPFPWRTTRVFSTDWSSVAPAPLLTTAWDLVPPLETGRLPARSRLPCLHKTALPTPVNPPSASHHNTRNARSISASRPRSRYPCALPAPEHGLVIRCACTAADHSIGTLCPHRGRTSHPSRLRLPCLHKAALPLPVTRTPIITYAPRMPIPDAPFRASLTA